MLTKEDYEKKKKKMFGEITTRVGLLDQQVKELRVATDFEKGNTDFAKVYMALKSIIELSGGLKEYLEIETKK